MIINETSAVVTLIDVFSVNASKQGELRLERVGRAARRDAQDVVICSFT